MINDGTNSLAASQIFWGLNDQWWRQIIDGKYHEFGSMVFDQGLHRGTVETGFYENAKKASEFACKHLEDPITVTFYQGVHQNACLHFKAAPAYAEEEDQGLYEMNEEGIWKAREVQKTAYCKAHNIGKFLSFPGGERLGCCDSLAGLLDPTLPRGDREKSYNDFEENKELVRAVSYLNNNPNESFRKEKYLRDKQITDEKLKENFIAAQQGIKNFNKQIDDKITKINSYIEQISTALGVKPIAYLKKEKSEDLKGRVQKKVRIYYRGESREFQMIVEKLFNEFEEKIKKTDSESAKISCIANLYQILEWLHPFEDGQGRTDLILLAKLLSQHGMNPSILEEPYVSTFSTLDEWSAYLKLGIDKWRNFRALL